MFKRRNKAKQNVEQTPAVHDSTEELDEQFLTNLINRFIEEHNPTRNYQEIRVAPVGDSWIASICDKTATHEFYNSVSRIVSSGRLLQLKVKLLEDRFRLDDYFVPRTVGHQRYEHYVGIVYDPIFYSSRDEACRAAQEEIVKIRTEEKRQEQLRNPKWETCSEL